MAGLERNWVRMLDSSRWRRYSSSAPMRRLLGSQPFQHADSVRRYVTSGFQSRRQRDRYRELTTLCLVIGHTKSGGTMLGALLDAHPEVAMSDELDALRYVSDGFTVHQLAYLIEKAARREALKGRVTARRLEPYSFAVPGEAQGRCSVPKVIGDTKAGIATQRLGNHPDLLDRVIETAKPLDVRFIHVVRNPFDPISVMRVRGRRTFEGAVERYFENCRLLVDIRRRMPAAALRTVRYESAVSEPSAVVLDLCRHVGIEPSRGYLEACARVIGHPRRERTLVDWTKDEIGVVSREIARYDFLEGYAFEVTGSPS